MLRGSVLVSEMHSSKSDHIFSPLTFAIETADELPRMIYTTAYQPTLSEISTDSSVDCIFRLEEEPNRTNE
jgi:hypothetical protein